MDLVEFQVRLCLLALKPPRLHQLNQIQIPSHGLPGPCPLSTRFPPLLPFLLHTRCTDFLPVLCTLTCHLYPRAIACCTALTQDSLPEAFPDTSANKTLPSPVLLYSIPVITHIPKLVFFLLLLSSHQNVSLSAFSLFLQGGQNESTDGKQCGTRCTLSLQGGLRSQDLLTH